jgi:hypothetical protein
MTARWSLPNGVTTIAVSIQVPARSILLGDPNYWHYPFHISTRPALDPTRSR